MLLWSWEVSSFDDQVFRFGLLWKCFDLAASLDDVPMALAPPEQKWIEGGYDGTAFLLLVEASNLS